MQMSHNRFQEDVDNGSVQNSRYIYILCVLSQLIITTLIDEAIIIVVITVIII